LLKVYLVLLRLRIVFFGNDKFLGDFLIFIGFLSIFRGFLDIVSDVLLFGERKKTLKRVLLQRLNLPPHVSVGVNNSYLL
jgi:hypothetical protein